MIFLDSSRNKLDDICSLGEYHPYKLSDGTINPDFRKSNNRSGQILNIKGNQPAAITFFFNELNPLISKGIAIAVVPSHDFEKTDSGLHQLARRLASNGRIDATSCLSRHKTIDKLASGGKRSINVHLDSIKVENLEVIRNREVLLLDDVTTSGNSLSACKQLLQQAGVQSIQCVALAQTIRNVPNQIVEPTFL